MHIECARKDTHKNGLKAGGDNLKGHKTFPSSRHSNIPRCLGTQCMINAAHNSSWESISSSGLSFFSVAMLRIISSRYSPLACSHMPRSSALNIDTHNDSPGKGSRSSGYQLKSLVKQISKYDDDTKLSMKVYHFQELIRLCGVFREEASNSTLKDLRRDILNRDSLKLLSPAQITGIFRSLSQCIIADSADWALLCDALKHLSPRMTCAERAICLYTVAKTDRAYIIRDRIIETVLKDLLSESNSWTLLDMGMMLYFMRKCEKRDNIPVWDKCLLQIAYRFNERLDSTCSPRSIACILHEFGLLRLIPAKGIHRACQKLLDTGLTNIDLNTLMLIVNALCNLQVREKRFLYHVTKHLVAKDLKHISESGIRDRIMSTLTRLNVCWKTRNLSYKHL